MKKVAIPGIIVIVIILHQLRLEIIKQVKTHQREVQPHHIILVAVHIVEQAKRDTPIVVVITAILLATEAIKIHMAIAIATNLEKMAAEKVDTAARHQKKTVHMTVTEAVPRVAIRVRFFFQLYQISLISKILFAFLFYFTIRNITSVIIDNYVDEPVVQTISDTIYISNLSKDVTEEKLAEKFGSLGMLKIDRKTQKPKSKLFISKT
jgi:hypothetical protein